MKKIIFLKHDKKSAKKDNNITHLYNKYVLIPSLCYKMGTRFVCFNLSHWFVTWWGKIKIIQFLIYMQNSFFHKNLLPLFMIRSLGKITDPQWLHHAIKGSHKIKKPCKSSDNVTRRGRLTTFVTSFWG